MNQTIAPDSEQNEIPAPSIAAGQRLREARDALGLSREDVARELRLQEKLIAALEEGDRSQLPPSAFISGYLRSYARLLGLPAEQLITDYLAERVPPALYRATDRTGMPVFSSRDPKFKIATVAIVVVTALLFGAWWANQRFSLVSLEPAQTATSGGEQHEIEAKLPEPMPLYQEPHPEEETVPEQSADGKTPAKPASATSGNATPQPAAAAPAPAQPRVMQPTTAVPATAQPRAPQPVTAQQVAPGTTTIPVQKSPGIQPPAAPSASAPQTVPAKPASPTPAATTEPLSPSVPQSLLVMEYQAACWTQVEDANGRVLAYGTISAGRKLQLHGVAPFKVYLGYAQGVTVYYNGTLFSHAEYQHGDLARFSVGSTHDNRPLVR